MTQEISESAEMEISEVRFFELLKEFSIRRKLLSPRKAGDTGRSEGEISGLKIYQVSHSFTLEDLKQCLNSPSSQYHSFQIPKKSGGVRKIDAPAPKLKNIQRAIADLLRSRYTPEDAAHGFVPARSVVSNAQEHLDHRFILNVDIKDFFPSISYGRVKYLLMQEPFGFQDVFAHMAARLCTKDGVLPQGSPASPEITNMVCRRLDQRLSQLALARNLTYTRYADDITFSGAKIHLGGRFFGKLERIIEAENFKLNLSKTRLLGPSMRKEVTGITVNERPNASRAFIRGLRAMMHNWETLGLGECQKKFRKLQGSQSADFERHVYGKISYLSMIRGVNDPLVERYFERYNRLTK